MTFESRLTEALGRYADLADVAVDPAIARRAIRSPRRLGLSLLGWAPDRRAAWAAVALLLIAVLAAAVVVGALLNRRGELLGRFSDVGPSQIAYITTAAVLGDGRVVVFGDAPPTGSDPALVTRVELFDPATNAFTPVASLSEARTGFTATALRDGTILIAGGDGTASDQTVTSTAEAQLLDPRTGVFTPTGSLGGPRSQHTATLLADGRVLVIGGYTAVKSDTSFLWSAEVYDPAAGAWSDAGSLVVHRSHYTTTLLPDGGLLLAGGWNQEDGIDHRSVEVFDPVSATFSAAGEMVAARRFASAALLADGRVLIVGGQVNNSVLATAEIYDPATGRSTPTGSLVTERYGASTFALADGRRLVAGGGNLVGQPLSIEIFDPATGTFAPGAMAARSHGGPAVQLADGRVLMTGPTSELLDPRETTEVRSAPPRTDGLFVATATPRNDRTGHTATKLADGRVLIVGGLESRGARGSEYQALATAEIFDPRSGTFTGISSFQVPSNASDLTGKLGNDGVLLDDGRVLLLVQKHRFRMGPEWSLQAFDPATERITTEATIASDNQAEGPARLVEVSDGRLLIIGASLTPSDPPTPDLTVYALDLPAASATSIGLVPDCGTIVDAVVLAGDRIAVLCRPREAEALLVLFDAAAGTSVPVAIPMPAGPAGLVGLADGRVLVGGGTDFAVLTVVDPASGQATAAGTAHVGVTERTWPEIAYMSMTVLQDGRVLTLSGADATVWDPATSSAAPLAGPITSRQGHTATLLDDGRVLIFGGTIWPADNGVPTPPGAELFDPAAIP